MFWYLVTKYQICFLTELFEKYLRASVRKDQITNHRGSAINKKSKQFLNDKKHGIRRFGRSGFRAFGR